MDLSLADRTTKQRTGRIDLLKSECSRFSMDIETKSAQNRSSRLGKELHEKKHE